MDFITITMDELIKGLVNDTNKEKKEKLFITLTYAQSLDGCLTYEKGKQFAISSKSSLQMTHTLRTLHDGILIGVETLLIDNPSLNARLVDINKSPQPIILDSNLRINLDCKLLTNETCRKPFIVCCCNDKLPKMEILQKMGATVIKVKKQNNRIDLEDLCNVLFKEHKIKTLMVEGGASIITSFLKQPNLLSKVILTISPMVLGGVKTITEKMIVKMKLQKMFQLEDDIIASYTITNYK